LSKLSCGIDAADFLQLGGGFSWATWADSPVCPQSPSPGFFLNLASGMCSAHFCHNVYIAKYPMKLAAHHTDDSSPQWAPIAMAFITGQPAELTSVTVESSSSNRNPKPLPSHTEYLTATMKGIEGYRHGGLND
jgi:hypothetical protein